MNLFTVQLELGPETRAMIERVAANFERVAGNFRMELELGPKTITALIPGDSKGLLRKGADAVRK
jgi:hypothetical protein